MSAIKNLQKRIDELILQIDLGKLEAIEHVEESKAKLRTLIDKMGESTSEAVTQPLKKQLDELKLQLQLGKMESRDIYLKQRETIGNSIDKSVKAMKDSKHHASEEFHETAHSLNDKIHMLGFNLGVGMTVAAEEAELAKEKFKIKLSEVADTLKANKELAGEKARETAEESHNALAEIRSNLRALFK